jgi:hypothetical protein
MDIIKDNKLKTSLNGEYLKIYKENNFAVGQAL